jgi:hypothetical protein
MLFDRSTFPLRREPLGDLGKNCETRVSDRGFSSDVLSRATPDNAPTNNSRSNTGKLTVQRNNTNNEPNAQHHHNERVDLETGALVGVELQHSRAAATGTSGACA